MMDLRLLGVAFKSVPVSEFTSLMLSWTRGAFAVMVITGVLLFYSNPDRSPEINVDWTAQVVVTSVNYGQP